MGVVLFGGEVVEVVVEIDVEIGIGGGDVVYDV